MGRDSVPFPPERIVLGTAQFGLEYGVANVGGAPDDERIGRILALARTAGIRMLDTAIAYGNAEERLGRLGFEGLAPMTKLPAVPAGCHDVGGWVESQVRASMARLRVARLAAVSLHRPAQLREPVAGDLVAALQRLRSDGLASAIGVSIYSPEELPTAFDAFDFDLVQAPYSVFDRRIVASGWSAELQRRGCSLHLRSCFLQGLLLLPAGRRPEWCRRWASLFECWDSWLSASGLQPLEACLRFALSAPGQHSLVLGVDNCAQLEAILAATGDPLLDVPESLACSDMDLVNPARWPRQEK